jgi:hypothetical protein
VAASMSTAPSEHTARTLCPSPQPWAMLRKRAMRLQT